MLRNLSPSNRFCFENMFLLALQNKKTEKEKWRQIIGEPFTFTRSLSFHLEVDTLIFSLL